MVSFAFPVFRFLYAKSSVLRLAVVLLLTRSHAFLTSGAMMPTGRWTITETNDPWITRMGPEVSVFVEGDGFRVNNHVFGTFKILSTPQAVKTPAGVDVAMKLWNIPLLARRFTLHPMHTHRVLLTTADRSKYYHLERTGM